MLFISLVKFIVFSIMHGFLNESNKFYCLITWSSGLFGTVVLSNLKCPTALWPSKPGIYTLLD